MPKKNSPGGCKCCGPCATLTVSVQACGGIYQGATVTVTGPNNFGASCTTGANGSCSFQVPNGTNTVSVSATGFCTPASQQITIQCPTSGSLSFSLRASSFTITVSGACNQALAGATVTLSGGGSCTTGSNGQCTLTIPCSGGPFTITASKARFVSSSITITAADLNSGVCSTGLTLTPAAGYLAWNLCADPISTTLHGTSAAMGAFTLTYNATSGNYTGTLTFNFPGCSPGCAAAAGVSVTISLTPSCNNTTGSTSCGVPTNALCVVYSCVNNTTNTCPGASSSGFTCGDFHTNNGPYSYGAPTSSSCPPTFQLNYSASVATNTGTQLTCNYSDTITITE